MSLTTLIFDVDGTLADTERDGHRVAFNRAFADAGLDWRWDPILYGELLAVTGGKERMRYYVERFRPDYVIPGDFTELAARVHAAKNRYYAEILASGDIPLRPGVRRLLTEARRAGIRLAIATTTSPANVTALLEDALDPESPGWFELIAAGDDVPNKKPAPDIYLYALDRMGVSTHECLAIEDSENGLRSARGAGLKTVITVNDYTRMHDFEGAALVLDSLGEPKQPFTVIYPGRGVNGARMFNLDLARQLLST
ncbi:MAG: HAD family hydrolase [Acidiferrobacterales bacterium]